MNADPHDSLARLDGAVATTLVPVVPIAFLWMPLSPLHHPDVPLLDANAPAAHMT